MHNRSVAVGRSVPRSVYPYVYLSDCWSVENPSARATRVANKRQRYRRALKASLLLSAFLSLSPSPFLCPYSFLSPSLSRFLPLSVRASSGSEFSLHPALLILLFLACCLCPCLGRCWSLVRPPSAARRARENISWPSGGSAEAFSQLAVMARPAASVSAN